MYICLKVLGILGICYIYIYLFIYLFIKLCLTRIQYLQYIYSKLNFYYSKLGRETTTAWPILLQWITCTC